jgi:hypothetical protein
MSRKELPVEKIEQMFAAYCERQTASFVSEKCRVHFKTAKKYIQTHSFAARLAKVQEKVETVVGDSIAARKVRELKILDNAFANYVEALNATVTASAVCKCGKTVTIAVPGLKAKLSDIESLIRTRCLVTGEATERKESTEEAPRLIKWCLPVPPEILKKMGAMPQEQTPTP